jgi:hypothetical protein
MRRGVRLLRRGAFGLGIAVALAFGGLQALAGPTNAMAPCDENPPDFGTCIDKEDCQLKCDNYYGDENAEGFCVYYPPLQQDCCICILS